jgi:hypothetical protein
MEAVVEENTQTLEEIFGEVWAKLQRWLQTAIPSLCLPKEKEHLLLTGLNRPSQLAWLVSVDKLSIRNRTDEELRVIEPRRQAIKGRNITYFIPLLEGILQCPFTYETSAAEKVLDFATVIMTLVDELE